ncbi:hypothetical protein OUZ56_012534 [Daphnia magna]|uniref:Uncharacterized protein n=1 Tax=Daphnia magna TaxID=35525 RepID=A0ABQ9Z3A2_9CRUS|nr:hypothetical protein OUZ56_012534 [Daphnia magna]
MRKNQWRDFNRKVPLGEKGDDGVGYAGITPPNAWEAPVNECFKSGFSTPRHHLQPHKQGILQKIAQGNAERS